MDLSNFWRVLLRRWYLTLAALVVVAATAVVSTNREGPTFEAEGSVLLFPPMSSVRKDANADANGNPYLLLGGLSQARDIVIRALSARSAADDFGQTHPGASYTATPDFTSGSPIVVLTIEAPSREAARAGLDDVMGRIPVILVDLQSDLGISDSSSITSTRITQDTTPTPILKGQVRAALAGGGAAAVVSLLLIGLIDGLLLGRRQRRAASATDEDQDQDHDHDHDTGAESDPSDRESAARRQDVPDTEHADVEDEKTDTDADIEPDDTEPDEAEPDKAEPDEAEPDKAESPTAEADVDADADIDADADADADIEPDDTEPDKAEPDEAESPTKEEEEEEEDAPDDGDEPSSQMLPPAIPRPAPRVTQSGKRPTSLSPAMSRRKASPDRARLGGSRGR